MNITTEEFAALKAEVAALAAKMAESNISKEAKDCTEANADYSDAFGRDLIGRLQRDMERDGTGYGLAVSNIVSQTTKTGGAGTAMSIITISRAEKLPTDEKIAENVDRVRALIADPLTLRVLRQMIVFRFEGKPMRGTAAELAAALNETPEKVDAALRPLVDNGTLQRGLGLDDAVFYQWDGNNHVAMTILIR